MIKNGLWSINNLSLMNFQTFSVLVWCLIGLPIYLQSQINTPQRIDLQWEENLQELSVGTTVYRYGTFDNAQYDEQYPTLRFYGVNFPVSRNGELTVNILEANYEDYDFRPLPSDDAYLSDVLDVKTDDKQGPRSIFWTPLFCPYQKGR